MKTIFTVLFMSLTSSFVFGQSLNQIDDNCDGFNPDFNYTFNLPAGGIQFKDASGLLTSTSLSYHWDFDQGHTSEKQSPFMVFSEEKSYQITLKVTDNNGCTATVKKVVDWSYQNH